MIEHVVIIGLCVFAIYYTMLEGEIFGGLGTWFYEHLPHKLHQSIFECPICMVPWYGGTIYCIMGWYNGSIREYVFTLMATMGFNYILNKIGGRDTTFSIGADD